MLKLGESIGRWDRHEDLPLKHGPWAVAKWTKNEQKSTVQNTSENGPKTTSKAQEPQWNWEIHERRNAKKGVKIGLQKWWVNDRPKSHSQRGARDRISVRQALNKRQFECQMYKTSKNLPENPKNPMKQAISGAMADRKRTMKMIVKNRGKNAA
jgi:hypothetical protein